MYIFKILHEFFNSLKIKKLMKIRKKLFFRIMISYLAMLFLTLATGILFNDAALEVIEKNLEKTNLMVIEQCKDNLDQKMEVINNLVFQISNNTEIYSFYDYDKIKGDEFYMKLIDVNQQVRFYNMPGDFIDKLYVYFLKSDIMVSASGGSFSRDMYNNEIRYTNIEYDELISYLRDRQHNMEFMPSENVQFGANYENLNYNVITFLQSIPLLNSQKYKGLIMMLIKEETIRNMLKNIDISDGGWVYVLNGEGRIITGISSSKHQVKPVNNNFDDGKNMMNIDINGESMNVFYATSQVNGWRYVSVIPESIAMKQLYTVKVTILGAIAICTLFGILLALLLTVINIKPVKEIVRIVFDYFSDGRDTKINENEYEYLKGNLKDIIKRSKDIEISMKKQMPLIKHAFFNQLIRGDTHFRDEEMDELAKVSGLKINSSLFGVAVISISQGIENSDEGIMLEKTSISKVVIEDMLKGSQSDISYNITLDSNKIILLMSSAGDNEYDLKQKIRQELMDIIGHLQSEYGFSVKVGVGGYYQYVNDLYLSYNEAVKAVYFNHSDNQDNILWYSDIKEFRENFYYPVDIEARLINMALTGEKEEVKRILEFINDENNNKRKLNYLMQQQLAFEMLGTLNKITGQIPDIINTGCLQELFDHTNRLVKHNGDLSKVFDNISRYYEDICLNVNRKKDSSKQALMEQILMYISASYQDSSLSLSSIAAQCKISDAYLSRVFKEQTAENISEYIERVRLEKACDLLKKSDHLINDLFQKVGYNSAESFRRAFKRAKGISPSEYRQFL